MNEWLSYANTAIGLVMTVGGVVVGLILYLVRARSGITTEISEARIAARDEVENIGARMHQLEAEMDALKSSVARLPGAEDIRRIDLNLTRIEGQMDRQDAILERLERVVIRVDDHLMGRGT